MAPTFNPQTALEAYVPVAILSASLLGSAHCVSMCGGLTLFFGQNKRSLALYHLGRLISYSSLGALAGAFGKTIFSSSIANALPWLTTVLIGVPLITLGTLRILNRPLHFKLPPVVNHLYKSLWPKKGTESSFGAVSIGFLSAFLPCGWLYSFVIAATVSQNALIGGIALAFFWLGTVPALSFSSILLRKVLSPLNQVYPKIAGILLITAGVFTIAIRTSPLVLKGIEKQHSPTKSTLESSESALGSSCPHHSN